MEFEKIQKIISEVLGVDEDSVTMETTFVDDLGADSLDVFQIIMAIEEELDIEIANEAAEKIVTVAKANGSEVSGPIPLPTNREIVTILRSPHVNKDSREQFETRTHKRLIDIMKPSQKTVDALMSIELPAGVEIEVKL